MFIWITSHLWLQGEFGTPWNFHADVSLTSYQRIRMCGTLEVLFQLLLVERSGGPPWGLWWWNDIRIPKTGKLKLASGKWTLDFEDVWILLKMGIFSISLVSLPGRYILLPNKSLIPTMFVLPGSSLWVLRGKNDHENKRTRAWTRNLSHPSWLCPMQEDVKIYQMCPIILFRRLVLQCLAHFITSLSTCSMLWHATFDIDNIPSWQLTNRLSFSCCCYLFVKPFPFVPFPTTPPPWNARFCFCFRSPGPKLLRQRHSRPNPWR